jgi:hypothetical protein
VWLNFRICLCCRKRKGLKKYHEAVCAGEEEIPGLTDENKPKMRGPKRASKIRKLYNLSKEDDVRAAVKLHARKIEKGGKTITKVPKIQRLVTPATLQRKRRRAALKKKAIEKVCLGSYPTAGSSHCSMLLCVLFSRRVCVQLVV